MAVSLNVPKIPDSSSFNNEDGVDAVVGLHNDQQRFNRGVKTLITALPDQSLAGGQRRYIVESQAVNDPPGSPSAGQYWIVGSSPTGDWTGYAKYIATKYSGDSSWTLIAPKIGDEAYDRNTLSTLIWGGSSWDPSSNAWSAIAHYKTAGTGSTTTSSATNWAGTSAPTTSISRIADDVTITATVASGKLMRFMYSARMSPTLTTTSTATPGVFAIPIGVAIFRDSETTALLWRPTHYAIYNDAGTSLSIIFGPYNVDAQFYFTADDSSSHTYKAAIAHGYTAQYAISTISERDFSLEVSN